MDLSEKQKLIEKLQKKGYNAYFHDGILYFSNIAFSEIEKIVKEVGYRGSYGLKQDKEANNGI